MEIRFNFKIVLMGNIKTGKTQFMNKWTKDIFSNTYKETIVSEFWFKIFEKNGQIYRIKIWDITGNDEDHMTSKIFTKDSHGYIIMSDATNKKTREE